MPKIEIKHLPFQTPEDIQHIFKQKFGDSYEIYQTQLIGIDFTIKKTNFTGVGIKLIKRKDKSYLKFNALAPSFWVRFLFYGIIPLIILYLGPWSKITNEIKEFIANEPNFKL